MVRPAVVALFLVGVLGCVLAGCYDVPKPVCGFYCGADNACPGDYSCHGGRCILNSALSTIDLDNIGASCELVDASFVPGDLRDIGPIDQAIGPTVVNHVPIDLAPSVSINSIISVTFSEPVTQVSTNTFVVNEQPSGPFGGSTPVLGTVTQPTPTTAVFTPTEPLAMGAAYTVFVSSPVQDLDGNPLPFTQWSFKTEPDTVPPTIVSQTPAPDATGVPIDAPITVKFSERMMGIDFSTFVLRVGGNQIGGNPSFDVATNTATFTVSGRLQPNTTYDVALSAGITDRGNNSLVGAPITWSFTTGPDTIPPMLVAESPLPNATDVNPTFPITVLFDEEVVNVTNATFTLRAGATVVASTVTYFSGSAQAQLRPNTTLASNTVYTVTLDAAITDAAGNALAGAPITWTFTTRMDTTAPFVSNRMPFAGASDVSPDTVVTVTFSESVLGVSSSTLTLTPGGGSVFYDASARTATLFPTTTLATGTTYDVMLTTGITDVAGNALTPQSWSFTTTLDATAPSAMLTTPIDGATGVASGTPIVVLFDEPVTNVTLQTFHVYAPSPMPVPGMLTSAMSGREWTFTPFMPLPANTTVKVSLTNGISDNTGNQLVPVSYAFTTAP